MVVEEHITTFARWIVADNKVVVGMDGYRLVVSQIHFFVLVLTHIVVGIVVVGMVVDMMVPCFEMADFGLCKLVELPLEMSTTWR